MVRLNDAPENVSGYDELPVNGYCVLPNGRLMLADAKYGDLAQRQLPQLVLVIDNTCAKQ
jgi:hypothetical protein